MKRLSRKERERAARREAIIDAAEQLISEKGFENVTMDDIAEKAELGKGTLYLHFKSKTAIYLAICERGSALLNEAMSKVFLLEIDGVEMIYRLGEVYFEFIRSNSIYFIAFNYYENLLNDGNLKGSSLMKNCEEHARQAMTYIIRALQIGMQDGSIRSNIDPKQLGLIIWGASKGIVQMAFLKEKEHHLELLDDFEFNLESLFLNFIELIGSGLRNDQKSKK